MMQKFLHVGLIMGLLGILVGVAASGPKWDAKTDFIQRCNAAGGELHVDQHADAECVFHLRAAK